MKYTDPLSKDHPPCKITNSAMNTYIAEVVQRFPHEKLTYLFTQRFDLSPEAFAPKGMPHTAPQETSDYKTWKVWDRFVQNCFTRAMVAAGATARYFDSTGVKAPSRDALVQVFLYKLQFVK